eukprot:gb/GEZN01018120.1/.p1 GENE.gb/GEZN01018120.1/~~gb/GEZN01018120.1/.p1  ORF type:complete len:117 (-),score=4.80 gb/GEZN01018120.1/:27-377(-)
MILSRFLLGFSNQMQKMRGRSVPFGSAWIMLPQALHCIHTVSETSNFLYFPVPPFIPNPHYEVVAFLHHRPTHRLVLIAIGPCRGAAVVTVGVNYSGKPARETPRDEEDPEGEARE